MNQRRIDGAAFRAMLASGLKVIKANAEEINSLNVFPIPDGDTGDNMVSTLSGGLHAVAEGQNDIGVAAQAAAEGMLLGARGNSGVILSQMFAGIAVGLSGKQTADVAELSSAFTKGVQCAYSSLSQPVEGTILTVMRRAAEFAGGRVTEESTVSGYLSDYEEEAERTLQQTPELLDVLKQAGTIDSGGAGLVAIVRGFLNAANGREEQTEGERGDGALPARHTPGAPDISLFTEDSVLTFGYCTEFLLRLTNAKTDISAFSIEDFRAEISRLGQSVVAFRQGTVVKVHVHVMEPWQVLKYAQSFGEFLTVKIENMNIQHSEAEGKKQPAFSRRGARKEYGVAALCCGAGLCAAFKELGADIIIDEEKYGNPSVELLIQAVEAANADTVFLLPNNSNVIVAANEAASACKSCNVRVLPTRSLGEGYVALSSLDCDSGDADKILSLMQEEVSSSVSGAVARAVRSTEMCGVSVKQGDYIAMSGKNLLAASDSVQGAAVALARSLGAGERDFIIVFFGCDTNGDCRAGIRAALSQNFPSAEYYEIDGGQKIYDVIMVVQ